MLKNCVLVTILGIPAMAHAQAWKCQIDGKTVFSDVPCKGTFIDTSKLNGNTVAPVKEPVRQAPLRRTEEYAAAPMGGFGDSRNSARAGCPTPIEVKNLETSASSNAARRSAAEQDQIRVGLLRAGWCKQGLDPDVEEAAFREREAARLKAKKIADDEEEDERTKRRARRGF